MLKTTLLSAFTEMPAEFDKEVFFACLGEVSKLEQEIEASGRSEAITSEEIKQIIRANFYEQQV